MDSGTRMRQATSFAGYDVSKLEAAAFLSCRHADFAFAEGA